MRPFNSKKISFLTVTASIFILIALLPACTILKQEQKGKPFVIKNSIEVKGGNFSKDELTVLKSRLNTQLEDSSKINVQDKLFFWHIYQKPAAFDTGWAASSAKNMTGSMLHLGYYRANTTYSVDTIKRNKYVIFSFRKRKFPFYKQPQQRVHVTYSVYAGKSTIIDTVSYRLHKQDLQSLAIKNIDKSILRKDNIVSKAAVLGELSRLVDLYRNNGYYKFTSEELKVNGDTSLEALTTISDDPFEQLQQLILSQQKRDSPKIKLAIVLNPPTDSSRLMQYRIRNIIILPDYRPGDSLSDKTLQPRFIPLADNSKLGYSILFHNKRFRSGFLIRNMFIKPGQLYNQTNYYKTLNSFARTGTWQSVNIEPKEVKDSVGQIDMIVQLIPAGQYVFEASLEASYSANSTTNSVSTINAGNLLGTSANISFANRNFKQEGIRWTSSIRGGIELNLNSVNNTSNNLINSNEIGFNNTFAVPRFLFPLKKLNSCLRINQQQTFVNLNASLINRIGLFNLQSINFGYGYTWHNRKNGEWTLKLFNVEFARLFNESEAFKKTLEDNPFLKYSFNTALVAGFFNFSYNASNRNALHPSRENSFKANFENSGFLPKSIFEKYMKLFVKFDVEYKHSRNFLKSAVVFRSFLGVGVPFGKDTALPFFKQYFGGGSNSMRGWPVRGIGRGSQKLAPYANSRFNDRTGDIQFETNFEYRYNIAQLTSWMNLKGALFIDAGNVWNMRNSKPLGITDSALFKFKHLWRDMGINVGTGFRFDFSYASLRLDLGFRVKRPETAYVNNGWKIPALSFNDVLPKLFARGYDNKYKIWRYENFNFTIGINLPF